MILWYHGSDAIVLFINSCFSNHGIKEASDRPCWSHVPDAVQSAGVDVAGAGAVAMQVTQLIALCLLALLPVALFVTYRCCQTFVAYLWPHPARNLISRCSSCKYDGAPAGAQRARSKEESEDLDSSEEEEEEAAAEAAGSDDTSFSTDGAPEPQSTGTAAGSRGDHLVLCQQLSQNLSHE